MGSLLKMFYSAAKAEQTLLFAFEQASFDPLWRCCGQKVKETKKCLHKCLVSPATGTPHAYFQVSPSVKLQPLRSFQTGEIPSVVFYTPFSVALMGDFEDVWQPLGLLL